MSATNTLTERTALSGFTLRGQPVAKGQIVALDPFELNQLVDKGCVARTDGENARVPRAELPPFEVGLSEAETIRNALAEARSRADDEMRAIERRIADARAKADTDVEAVQTSSTERLEALGREVREAEIARDNRLAELKREVEAAEAAAQETIAAAEAKAKAGESEGAGRRGTRQS